MLRQTKFIRRAIDAAFDWKPIFLGWIVIVSLSPAAFAQNTTTKFLDATLRSKGGDLNFLIKVTEKSDGQVNAFIVNGAEEIPIDEFHMNTQSLMIGFPHYDSKIESLRTANGGSFVGKWTKRIGKNKNCVMEFTAKPLASSPTRYEEAFDPSKSKITGRWQVEFESSKEPAVGIFKQYAGGKLSGTFLTTTGDYRYLAGKFAGGKMVLACFDGAHAFLFKAELDSSGKLAGDFWSRDSWHEKWSARKNENAKLSDAFKLTRWQSNIRLGDMKFPDLDGKMRSLADKEFAGKPLIIYVFGSWCPNCHDAGKLIAEIKNKNAGNNLAVVGIAFELTGDQERDAQQVRRYLARHKTKFPVLLVGTADKKKASEKFTIIDRIRSYPTTIFVNRSGDVLAIHTGFSGPATGKAHEDLKARFYKLTKELVD